LPEGDDPTITMNKPETILVVENGDMLRPLICEILRKEGFTVLEASDGDAALQVWQGHQEPIDLVLTDVVMQNMSGKKLVELLQLSHPDIKVLYMSGYDYGFLFAGDKSGAAVNFLQKPFKPAELIKKVRDVLASHS
jgi:two-component system, cell cycle sensor histidine kinase and response regulator CckA